MGTRLNSRPIEKDVSSDILNTNSAMTLDYNLEKVQELYFSKYDNALIKMKGVQVTSAPTNKSVLSFNNTTYVFDKIIITNDFDKISKDGTTSPSSYDIALIFSFTETNGNRNLFLTIPLLAGSGGSTDDPQEFVNELLDEISNIDTNNTSNISLDEAFDLNNVLEYTGFNSNQYIYYSSSGTSLFIVPYLENSTLTDNNFLTSDFSTIFSSRTHVTSDINTAALYIMETPPQQVSNVMNENNLSDIYIDCSPISSDASYQIIEPRKLKLQTNLFTNTSKLISDNTFITLIVAITFLIIFVYIIYSSFGRVISFANDLMSIIYSTSNNSLMSMGALGVKSIDKVSQYKKFITIQTSIVWSLRFIALLSFICLISIIVLTSIQDKNSDINKNIFNVLKVVLWIFISIALSCSILLSFLKIILSNKMDWAAFYSFVTFLVGICSILSIVFLNKYAAWWKIIDKNTNQEKVFLGSMWMFVIIFSILTIIVYSPLHVLNFGSNIKKNEQKIVDEIMRADSFIIKLISMFSEKKR